MVWFKFLLWYDFGWDRHRRDGVYRWLRRDTSFHAFGIQFDGSGMVVILFLFSGEAGNDNLMQKSEVSLM